MGQRGPAPTPTATLKIRGSWRANRPGEPKPEIDAPRCPPHLDAEAKREWKRAAVELLGMGVLTRADRAILAMYCQSWSLWVKAERKLAKEGWIATTPNGHEQPSGWVQIRNKAMEQMHKFGSELGLSPAARTRIQVETQEKAPAVQKRKRRA